MRIKASTVIAGLVFCKSISALVIKENEMFQLQSLKNLTLHNVAAQAQQQQEQQGEGEQQEQQHNQQRLHEAHSVNRVLHPVSPANPPPSVFPVIKHPFPPVYANSDYDTVVPTNSWISNLFYPSVNNLAPTTPDPYILRLLDDFGGNPGLTISQPHDKVC